VLTVIPVSNCHLFSDINISQGSVATHLRCGGIFSYHFTANIPRSLTMTRFRKSVEIWQSYLHKFAGPVFFGTECILSWYWYACWKRKVFGWWLKVSVSVSSCSNDGRLFQAMILVQHRKMDVLQTSEACAVVRHIIGYSKENSETIHTGVHSTPFLSCPLPSSPISSPPGLFPYLSSFPFSFLRSRSPLLQLGVLVSTVSAPSGV